MDTVLAPIVFLLVALGALVVGALNGDVRGALVVVIPVLIVNGWAGVVFFVALAAAGVSYLWPGLRSPTADVAESHEAAPARSRSAGVVFLGPIPITWGVTGRTRLVFMVVGVAMAVGLAIWWWGQAAAA